MVPTTKPDSYATSPLQEAVRVLLHGQLEAQPALLDFFFLSYTLPAPAPQKEISFGKFEGLFGVFGG